MDGVKGVIVAVLLAVSSSSAPAQTTQADSTPCKAGPPPVVYLKTTSGFLAGGHNGIKHSSNGCDWKPLPEALAGSWVSDLHMAADGRVWATTSTTGTANGVYVAGADLMFAESGLRSETIWWKSVRTDAANPQVVFVVGYSVDRGPRLVMRRLVGGVWKEVSGAGLVADDVSTIRVVEVREGGNAVLASAGRHGGSETFRSRDGGESWSILVRDSSKHSNGCNGCGIILAATLVAWPRRRVGKKTTAKTSASQ